MNPTMRAAVAHTYGSPEVVQVERVPIPKLAPGRIMIRVVATPVTRGDTIQRAATFPSGMAVLGRLMTGLRGPRRPVLGAVFAGVVSALGAGVTDLSVGDRVAGVNGPEGGAHAEYVVAKAASCVRIPDEVSAGEAAATLFGGTTATYFLERGGLRPGARVLINGGSGEVGVMALQITRLRGATVTGVASGKNTPLMRELGADEVIDYTENPLETHRQRYDLVLDTVGNLGPSDADRLLKEDGRLVLLRAGLNQMIASGRRVVTGSSLGRADGAAELLESVRTKTLKPVIDRVFPLADVAAAHRRVDSLRKTGSVLIDISEDIVT
ncbi:NAD(P)-dependent alcohol dehydrogenase [Leifsonia sp. 2MCAF36]|uniref:NAD(P)-dependent alcohol dehydrogenase n=1 Tax=Leifsonia sp. 2MCAF36 TaxID=3232988 RepID=UPI003F9AAE6B